MTNQLHPFLVGPEGASFDDPRVVLVFAHRAEEAVQRHLKALPTGAVETSWQVVSFRVPEQVVLAPEMMQFELPTQLVGPTRLAADAKQSVFIVPDFLSGVRNAVIYARVSTKAQASNSSFSRQRDACQAFARAANLRVAASYEEVESGGFLQGRPSLQAALRDLEAGRAQVLLVEAHDRLARDASVLQSIVSRLQAAHSFLICCDVQHIGNPSYEMALHSAKNLYCYKTDLLHEWGLQS